MINVDEKRCIPSKTGHRSTLMRGRIVLVPFPFDDLSATKVRPALCLTDPIGGYDHVIVAFISSTITSPLLPTDPILDPSDPDFSGTGLRVRSAIYTHRLMTVSTRIVIRNLGQLSARQWQLVHLHADAEEFVILSAAKDLTALLACEILRYAQDDKPGRLTFNMVKY